MTNTKEPLNKRNEELKETRPAGELLSVDQFIKEILKRSDTLDKTEKEDWERKLKLSLKGLTELINQKEMAQKIN